MHGTSQTTARDFCYMAPHRLQPEISITWHLTDHNQIFLPHSTPQTTARNPYHMAPHRPQPEIYTIHHSQGILPHGASQTTARNITTQHTHRLQPEPSQTTATYFLPNTHTHTHTQHTTHTHTHTYTHTLTIIARFTVTRVAIDKVCALPMATRVRSTVIDIVLTERAGKASQTLTAGLSRGHPTASAVVLTWIVFLTNVYLLTLTACTWRGYKN